MTGSEMAEHLEKVANGVRHGNSACTAMAWEMLAARRMLEALEDAANMLRRLDRAAGDVGLSGTMQWDDFNDVAKFDEIGWQIRDAIAAAKGEPR